MNAKQVPDRKLRCAVVGEGWIRQAAAQTGNLEMTVLFTGDSEKAGVLGEQYPASASSARRVWPTCASSPRSGTR